jgi:hypothetical protein
MSKDVIVEDDVHKLTLRMPKSLHRSMQIRRGITGQSITSQLIEVAMRSEREFHSKLVPQQRVARESVMNTLYQ